MAKSEAAKDALIGGNNAFRVSSNDVKVVLTIFRVRTSQRTTERSKEDDAMQAPSGDHATP